MALLLLLLGGCSQRPLAGPAANAAALPSDPCLFGPVSFTATMAPFTYQQKDPTGSMGGGNTNPLPNLRLVGARQLRVHAEWNDTLPNQDGLRFYFNLATDTPPLSFTGNSPVDATLEIAGLPFKDEPSVGVEPEAPEPVGVAVAVVEQDILFDFETVYC